MYAEVLETMMQMLVNNDSNNFHLFQNVDGSN